MVLFHDNNFVSLLFDEQQSVFPQAQKSSIVQIFTVILFGSDPLILIQLYSFIFILLIVMGLSSYLKLFFAYQTG